MLIAESLIELLYIHTAELFVWRRLVLNKNTSVSQVAENILLGFFATG